MLASGSLADWSKQVAIRGQELRRHRMAIPGKHTDRATSDISSHTRLFQRWCIGVYSSTQDIARLSGQVVWPIPHKAWISDDYRQPWPVDASEEAGIALDVYLLDSDEPSSLGRIVFLQFFREADSLVSRHDGRWPMPVIYNYRIGACAREDRSGQPASAVRHAPRPSVPCAHAGPSPAQT